ncbi:TPA: hypothetical protein ACT96X_003021 [Legionella pneumophila]|uniref:hypothetical protein n=2 Tax=Legionella pneumophila TaxID=446 RepID=UPI00078738E4|nr:hypothetical protein [Legionella pneumophila]HAU1193285.1 hypothetical protein [Legionella pneumophila]HBD7103552.1 hypothetical protein [Legionella pneumophila]HCO4740193.1 hypothetical protein [Legionella pneumophila]HDU7931032.1 hypothetical protein [Legionella pneumophila]HDU7937101.1 hypothetical protein [Legionella pneumophila]
MKRLILFTLPILFSSVAVFASQKSVVCYMKGIEEPISFVIPNKTGNLPTIDFPYPVNVTRFSMRVDNLLLIAMDKEEADRPRIFISAQLNKRTQTYKGQFMSDLGGNQLQLDNGSVRCELK